MYSICTFSKHSMAKSLHPHAKYYVKNTKWRALQHNMHRWWLPYWNYHGEPLCTVIGRVPSLAHTHLSLFCSLQLSVIQQPISVPLNTDDDCLWILNSSTYPIPDPPFKAFLLAPVGRHNGSFTTQTDAKLIWRRLKVAKEMDVSHHGKQMCHWRDEAKGGWWGVWHGVVRKKWCSSKAKERGQQRRNLKLMRCSRWKEARRIWNKKIINKETRRKSAVFGGC